MTSETSFHWSALIILCKNVDSQVYNATYATAHRMSVTVMQKQNAIEVVFAGVQIPRLVTNDRRIYTWMPLYEGIRSGYPMTDMTCSG